LSKYKNNKFKKWIEEKKKLIKKSKKRDNLEDFQKAGIDSINEYYLMKNKNNPLQIK